MLSQEESKTIRNVALQKFERNITTMNKEPTDLSQIPGAVAEAVASAIKAYDEIICSRP